MHVESLRRYPVKGLSAETLNQIDLTAGHGFAFDRVYAVTDGSFLFDARHPQPMPKTHFLMLARYERLALLRTHFDPDARELVVEGAGDSRRFALDRPDGREALAAFLSEFIGVSLPGRPAVASAERHQFTDVSVHSTAMMRSISLINLATVRDLGRFVGQDLDPLRFRANVYFDGAEPWSELGWVGRELRVGDVALKIVKRTKRCAATCVNPADGTRDINVPVAIRQHQAHFDCGIYAEVIGAGRLQVGDPIVGM